MSCLLVGFLLICSPGPTDAVRAGKNSERVGRLKRNRSGSRPSHAVEKLNATTPAAKELLKMALPRDRRISSDLVWRRMHHRLVAEVEVCHLPTGFHVSLIMPFVHLFLAFVKSY
jgi:hypothetical protein